MLRFPAMFSRFFKKLFRREKLKASRAELEKILSYHFINGSLFDLALAHRSYVNSQKNVRLESNERLEFLGDSVLNIVITDYLYHQYPEDEEGVLAKIKSLVVSAKVLSLCAENWNLGKFIMLSRSEEKAGGRKRPSILADGYEAILGAVYLDGGLEAARALIHSSLIVIMDSVIKDQDLANYKSKLLEFAQSHQLGVPQYEVLEESGPEHLKNFSIGVFIQNEEYGRGLGNTKKNAEQAGAREALKRLESGYNPS